MASLFDKRFIVNTGKGGVGKTIISAAMAVAFAQQGKRVLLLELNVKDKLGTLFDVPEIKHKIVQIAPHISAVNTTPRHAMREYALMILKVKLVYKAVFKNRIVNKFLRTVPGLPEITMLGKAFYHEQERNKDGQPVWDVIIIDAPATGHGMFLLKIPQVISGAVRSGLMTTESHKMADLLRDQEKTSINLITLTEEMPVNETIEYQTRLRQELGVAPGYVIANAVFPPSFTKKEAQMICELRQNYQGGPCGADEILNAARFRNERCELQATYISKLRQTFDRPVIEVPFYFTPKITRQTLDQMAMHITNGAKKEVS